VVLAVTAAAAGCARKPPEPPPTRIVHDDRQRASAATIAVDVGPAKWTRSADGRETFVEGSVRNRGTTPTREIRVSVLGVDAAGNVVTRAEGQPTPQLVLPGASARYLVRLPNDPTITTFHVEAIGR
jgi:hypothetical protein